MILNGGVRVAVRQPEPPRVAVRAPVSERAVVVPVRGPAGPTGGGALVHSHPTPSATWTIPHGLGRNPHGVTVYVAGDLVDTDVHVDDINVVLTFASPTTGEAHIL